MTWQESQPATGAEMRARGLALGTWTASSTVTCVPTGRRSPICALARSHSARTSAPFLFATA